MTHHTEETSEEAGFDITILSVLMTTDGITVTCEVETPDTTEVMSHTFEHPCDSPDASCLSRYAADVLEEVGERLLHEFDRMIDMTKEFKVYQRTRTN